MFSGLCCESRLHLFERLFQKGFVDKGITKRSFKLIQSRENSGDIFPICLRVHRFIAEVSQALRSTIRDQFLNRGLCEGTGTECFVGQRA